MHYFLPWAPEILSVCYCTVITHAQNLRPYTYMYKGHATRIFALQPKSGSNWLIYAYYLSSRAHILRSYARPSFICLPPSTFTSLILRFSSRLRAPYMCVSVYYLVSLWLKCQYFLTRFIKQIMHSFKIVRWCNPVVTLVYLQFANTQPI